MNMETKKLKLVKTVESIQENADGTIVIKLKQSENSTNKESNQESEIDFEKDRISQQKTAERFGVSVQTIINWRKKNWIRGYRIGRPVFYRKSELTEASRIHPSMTTK